MGRGGFIAKELTLSEAIKIYRTLDSDKKNAIRIAVLASSTLKGIKETLTVSLHQVGITSEVYVSGYNQYTQEILDPNSKLYRFSPDIVFLFIDTPSILGDNYFLPYATTDSDRKKWINSRFRELQALVGKLSKRMKAKIVIHNFAVPTYSPLSILENKQAFGFHESIELLNAKLRDKYRKNNQVFVFDYESFCSNIGKEKIIDHTMYYLGDIKVNFDTIPRLCKAYSGYIKPLASKTKKCIVLDLDNTLWGGVVGEDGLSGIKLGPTPEGRVFWEFQKYLLALFHRGVILAINSKNNSDDVLEVFKSHPHMILKEQHFAAMQINWNDKASNMRLLAEELNIGLDSFVFFDDDEVNRELVKEQVPEVTVIDLPKNPALYVKTLHDIDEFSTLQLTEEDLKKGELYVKQRERVELEKSSTNLDDFLRGLKTVITVESIDSFTLPRVTQLTQKTNQFNLTTRRYQEEDINTLIKNGGLVIAIRVSDKFGDNGITGAAIVKKEQSHWEIDTFLLSCRVIGRRVEETLLYHVINEAKKAKVKKIVGEYIPTKKNGLVKDFYKNNGFALGDEVNGVQKWTFMTAQAFPRPKLVELINQ